MRMIGIRAGLAGEYTEDSSINGAVLSGEKAGQEVPG
jgi:hypothetical protein